MRTLLPRLATPLLLTLACLWPTAARAQVSFATRTEEGATATLRLAEETLVVRIDQQFAASTLTQAWVNETPGRLEGRYGIALGDGVRVHGFAYWNGEKKIIGEVFEKEVARQVYEEVTGLGRDPGLLERTAEGAFAFRVFPIEPGERKRIEVSFGRRLPRAGRTVTYRAPLGTPAARILVEVADERALGGVRSSTHELTVATRGGKLFVEAKARTADAKELVLAYDVLVADFTVAATAHRVPGHDGWVAIALAAPADLPAAAVLPKDLTVVIDHSGSMSGEPLAQARLAAEAVLARARDADRVNVVIFDDGVESLYPVPRAVTAEVRAEAIAYVRRITEGGGTDIAGALDRALASQLVDDRPDVILFLTDGQSDTQAALAVARKQGQAARIFTVGIGPGVEKPLLSRLAAMARGRFTYIENLGTIEERVARLYQQIESPVLIDVAVHADGARLERVYPRTLPDLARGEEVVIYGRLVGDGAGKITLTGRAGGREVAYSASLVPTGKPRPWVGRMWAESRVDDLLEEVALAGETEELKNETIELALAYNLVTPYTSFLAIPAEELTDGAREVLASARDRKRQIREAHKDAIALSRDEMPPGDPVLELRAPKNARQVTATFPFGLVEDLTWDESRERWRVRFLVPKDVVDGVYEAKVLVVHADGEVELATARYTIDSMAPDLEALATTVAGGVTIRVTARDGLVLGSVVAAVVGMPSVRIDLVRQDDGSWLGVLLLPVGRHEVRIVGADGARNEGELMLAVER